MNQKIVKIIKKIKPQLKLSLEPDHKFRDDLGFDSIDLAQLTVEVEEEFDVDIFANGSIERISEVLSKIEK
jgi:acyl carrier protein